jgi:hypothetical protein
MSFPQIPPGTTLPPASACDAAAWVVASVAFEELALAHIINAEGEKIQYVLGTLPPVVASPAGFPPPPPPPPPPQATLADLLAINESVRETLETIICKEIVLNLKLCQALHYLDEHCPDETVLASPQP